MKVKNFIFWIIIMLVSLGNGIALGAQSHSFNPLSLFDINGSPAVAADGNDNVSVTWGYLGLGDIPTILAKRYDANGEAIDKVRFYVSSAFAAPSLFNYDPDVATDSANNSIFTWCAYNLSYPVSNIQIVYKKVSPPSAVAPNGSVLRASSISPLQDSADTSLNLLVVPFSPVVAVDNNDNIAIAWSYFDFASSESGIYLEVISKDGNAITPVKVVDNINTEVYSGGYNPVLHYAPSIAFDGEGNIVVTWTSTGVMPLVQDGSGIFSSTVSYSKHTTSGSVLEGYDKVLLSAGFLSEVAVDSGGNMIIAWNTFDIFSSKVRIMAQVFTAGSVVLQGPLEVGIRPEFASSTFVDGGDSLLNMGIDLAADSEGNFFVTWTGGDLFANHIYLKKIYSEGYFLSNEMQVSQGYDINVEPSIAIDSLGTITVVWNKIFLADLFAGASVYGRRVTTDLQAMGDEFNVNVIY